MTHCPAWRKKQSLTPHWAKGLSKTDPRVSKSSESRKGKRFGGVASHDDATKKRISAKMVGNSNAHHRGDRQSFYGKIRMDSRWEVGVAKYLDSNSVEWKYSERSFVLSNGRHYFPDFFIYENGEFVKLIEVKGYFRDENRIKFELFKKDYPEVVVELWQGKDLNAKGIIDKSGKVIGL